MINNKLGIAATAALTMGGATLAHASPQFEAGDWTVTLDGNVNGFYTFTSCESSPELVEGGLACTEDGSGGDSGQSNIRTGLLPAKLGVSVAREQAGYDIEAYLSYWPGIDDGQDGGALGLGTANFRQVYLSFGTEQMGTLKIGRDLGIFGSDAILNDQTLLGVGAVSNATIRGGNTSLGGIGTGYLYADWKAQVSYWSPDFQGLSFALGIMDPWDPGTLAVAGTSGVGDGEQSQPGVEGKVNFKWVGPVDVNAWASFLTQQVTVEGADIDDTVYGFDVGARVDVQNFNFTAYYYFGSGIGTTAFLFDGFDSEGDRRDSDGGYLQAGFRIPGPNTLLSAAYGISRLDDNSPDPGTLVDRNERWTAGVYHPLTPSLNLVAEFNHVRAKNHDGDDNTENTVALGGVLFF